MPQLPQFRVANPTTTWLTIVALLVSFSAPAFGLISDPSAGTVTLKLRYAY
ncbi:MAG: hypothetical protein IPK72_08930 [Candidatus Eisenbacteria bacterium]|nr:hypothetical protein [Candidatus Eisenbacteria bacterium]